MTEQEVFQRLYETPESDSEMLRQLGTEISAECRRPAGIILDSWAGSPQNRGIPCATLCTELKELAVGEMLQRAGKAEPGMRVHFMQIVVAQQLAFRELLLTLLEPLLKDQRPTDEGASRAERVCDLAYFLARKIVPDGADAKQFAESKFLSLDPNVRSSEIKKWMQSKPWTAIFSEK